VLPASYEQALLYELKLQKVCLVKLCAQCKCTCAAGWHSGCYRYTVECLSAAVQHEVLCECDHSTVL
jgi:hypothetical protein